MCDSEAEELASSAALVLVVWSMSRTARSEAFVAELLDAKLLDSAVLGVL